MGATSPCWGWSLLGGDLPGAHAPRYYTPPRCGSCIELCPENSLNSKEYSNTY
jgi:hypothetical protein